MNVQHSKCSFGTIGYLKSSLLHAAYLTFVLMAVSMVLPAGIFAECKEYKIVEYEDRVEAVCVGEPLTEAQKKANQDEENRQEAAARRQRLADQKRQRDADAAAKAQTNVKAAEERKKSTSQPVTPEKTDNKNLINMRKF